MTIAEVTKRDAAVTALARLMSLASICLLEVTDVDLDAKVIHGWGHGPTGFMFEGTDVWLRGAEADVRDWLRVRSSTARSPALFIDEHGDAVSFAELCAVVERTRAGNVSG